VKPLLSAEQYATRIKQLGDQIKQTIRVASCANLGVAQGSFIFMADLARAIGTDEVRIEFLGVQSYGDETSSSGVVQITFDLTKPIDGKNVLVSRHRRHRIDDELHH